VKNTAAAPSRARQKQVSHQKHDTAGKSADYVNGAPTCPTCGRRLPRLLLPGVVWCICGGRVVVR
jgi:hypothetical protein